MKSDLPKVLHPVCGLPMLAYVLDACREAGVGRLVVVVGYGKEAVLEAFSADEDIAWVEQAEQKGTGHAALMCEGVLGGFSGKTLVIAGDMPLIRSRTLDAMLAESDATGDGVTLASSIFEDPTGYGRIARDRSGKLQGIVEHLDCTPEQLNIREVNISYYCFDNRHLFDTLRAVEPNNAKGEYYITDAVKILIERGVGAGAVATVEPADAMGINSRGDLASVNSVMQSRIQSAWMEAGVTIVDRGSTWIEAKCQIGAQTVIQPFTFISRGACVGRDCQLGPHAFVGEGERLADGSIVGPACAIGANQG